VQAPCFALPSCSHSLLSAATGKIPIDVNALKIDAMSISGHKVRVRVCACVGSTQSALPCNRLTRAFCYVVAHRCTVPRALVPCTCAGGRAFASNRSSR
jgi:hypothetical protein